jgi:hypothetical protein
MIAGRPKPGETLNSLSFPISRLLDKALAVRHSDAGFHNGLAAQLW